MAGELLFIGQYADPWQLAPRIVLALGVANVGWCAVAVGPLSLRVFRASTLLSVVCGVSGLWLHYRTNVQFESKIHPSLSGFQLFWVAMKGQVPPSVAPATVIQLGLLGLVYLYRHPAFEKQERSDSAERH